MLEVIRRLKDLKGERVVSLYLDLSPQRRQDRKFLKVFKDLTKDWGELEEFKEIEDFLKEPSNLKNYRAIALFVSRPLKLFEVIPLPYVYKDRLIVDENPRLREVLSIYRDFKKLGVLLLSRKLVRFFLIDAFGVKEVLDFLEPLYTRPHKFHSKGSSLKGAEGMRVFQSQKFGYGEFRFHTRIREEWHRLLKEVSDKLLEFYKEGLFEELVVGGLEGEPVKDIEGHLHTYLRKSLLGYIKANPSQEKEHQIYEKVLSLLEERSLEREREMMKELREKVGFGLAVVGNQEFLQKLSYGNLRLALIPQELNLKGFLCKESGILTLKEGDCKEPKELKNLVDYLIEELLSQGVEVVVIRREPLKELAGILRWKE